MMREHDEPFRLNLPHDLVGHAVWTPEGTQSGRRHIVYVTERARRRVAGILLAIVIPVLVLTLLLGTPTVIWWVVGVAAAVGIATAVYHRGGRAGFYELDEDGTLGQSLGRVKPDLSTMRRIRASHR